MASSGMAMAYAMIVKGYTQQKAIANFSFADGGYWWIVLDCQFLWLSKVDFVRMKMKWQRMGMTGRNQGFFAGNFFGCPLRDEEFGKQNSKILSPFQY